MDPDQVVIAFEGAEVEARIAHLKLEDGGIQAELLHIPTGGVASPYVNECLTGNYQVVVMRKDQKRAFAILEEGGSNRAT